MALEDYCCACTYMDDSVDSSGKYYCSRKGERRYANDPKCYNFCEAYSRSRYARENMYDNSKSHQSGGGCYLTTTMCDILGYQDDNYYLQTLRTFRDTVLKTNPKYFTLLLSYDTIGPMIAYELSQDENRTEIAQVMFTRFITQAVTAIEENKTEQATNIYVAMTHSLAERYNIDPTVDMTNIKDIDIAELGHGRIKTRKRVLEQN